MGSEVNGRPHYATLARSTAPIVAAGCHRHSITIARRFQARAAVVEAGGTRRHGHNNWRVVGGPRLTLGTTARSDFFVQVLPGVLIRTSEADWALLPGAGVDVGVTNSSAVRFQFDALVERSDARTAKSARASIWLVFC